MKNLMLINLSLFLLFSCNKDFDRCYHHDQNGNKCSQLPNQYVPSCVSYDNQLPFPSNTDIEYVGVYQGSYPSGEIGCFYYEPKGGSITINVNAENRKIILVLTSYSPVTWELKFKSEIAKSNLVGIILSGYHCQELMNEIDQIPIMNRSHDGGSNYFYAYEQFR